MRLGLSNGPARRYRMQQSIGQHRMNSIMHQTPFHPLHQQQTHFQQGNHQFAPDQPYPFQHNGFQQKRSFNQNKRGSKEGGLLSRLLGKNKQKSQPVPSNLFSIPNSPTETRGTGAAAGGLLQSLTNTESLTTMLSNTQKVLQAVETLGPVVSQYGPLVKNIPAMWKIYQGLKGNDSVTNETDNNKENASNDMATNIEDTDVKAEFKNEEKKAASSPSTLPPKKVRSGESVPKLFL